MLVRFLYSHLDYSLLQERIYTTSFTACDVPRSCPIAVKHSKSWKFLVLILILIQTWRSKIIFKSASVLDYRVHLITKGSSLEKFEKLFWMESSWMNVYTSMIIKSTWINLRNQKLRLMCIFIWLFFYRVDTASERYHPFRGIQAPNMVNGNQEIILDDVWSEREMKSESSKRFHSNLFFI